MKKICWILIGVSLNILSAAPVRLSSTQWNNKGSEFYEAGAYAAAERCFLQANRLAMAERPASTGELRTIAFNLAAVYRAEARYDKSESFYFKALALEPVPSNPVETIRLLNGLTLLYLSERSLPKAEEASRRALAVGGDANNCLSEVLDAGNNLALVLFAEGRYIEAANRARGVLALSSTDAQSRNLQRGTAYDTLGRISFRRIEYSAAERFFQQAAPLIAAAVGPNSAAAASVWNDLGRVKAATGDLNGAESDFKGSIAILRKIYGGDHPDVASSLRGLADVYRDRKHYGKAEQLYRQSLEIDENTFGSGSSNVAEDLNSLGSLAFRQRHLDRAQALFSQALQLETDLLGPQHPEVGTICGNLAVVYWQEQRFGTSEPLFQRAVSIRESHYGPTDPILANLLSEYALALRSNQRYAEAASKEVLAAKIQVKNALRAERSY